MATDRRADVTWKGSSWRAAEPSTRRRAVRSATQTVSWPARSSDETGGSDEPGGADRGRARRVLLDGALARPGRGGHAAGRAQDVGDRHVPAGRGDHEDRADGRRARSRASTRPRSRRPRRERRRTARCRRRSPACPRSRSTRRSLKARVPFAAAWPPTTSIPGSTSSSAPTWRLRRAWANRPSTTTTARRRRSGGG